MCRAVMAQYVAGSLPPTTQGWEGGGGEEGHSRYWPPGFRAPGSYPAPGPCLLYNCGIMTVGGPGQAGQGGARHAAGGGVAAAASATFLLANMQGLVGISRNKSLFLCDLAQDNNNIWCAVTEKISDSEILVHHPNKETNRQTDIVYVLG